MADDTSKPIVFVVDDDAEMLQATTLMLSLAGLHVEAFKSAEDFLEIRVPRDVPSCLLLDLRMTGLSGLGLQQRLAEERVTIPVIFLTGFGDVATAVDAIHRGAIDFLEKPVHRETLLKGVERALDVDAQSLILEKQATAIEERIHALSRRECDVFQLLLEGKSNKEIAAALAIGLPTATKHRSRVLQKLHARNVLELISVVGSCRAAHAVREADSRREAAARRRSQRLVVDRDTQRTLTPSGSLICCGNAPGCTRPGTNTDV
jgi:FixJ family two-component response regulator